MTYQPHPIKKIFHNSRRFFARQWLSRQKALQIALTGSHGKTNTSYVLSNILSSLGTTVATDINLDTTYNIPITSLKVTPWTKYVVFELGIDHPHEMSDHLDIVQPKIGIITGIAPVHTDKEHLGSLENLIKEKRKLIEALPETGYAILNYDDPNVRNMASYTKAKIIWFGTDKKNCDVWVDPKTIQLSLDGTVFELGGLTFGGQTSTVATRLIGKHHIYSVMAVFAATQAVAKLTNVSISPADFVEKLKRIPSLPGRMSAEPGPLETIVLNDSLRANPASMQSGLETLSEIHYEKGRKIAILGEMGELEHPIEEHDKIGELLSRLKLDYVVGIGPLQKYTTKEAVEKGMDKQKTIWVPTVYEAAKVLSTIIKKDDLMYLKGSLLRHVERVLLILEGKKVGCTVTLCPFYYHCSKCKYLKSGYQNKK